MGSPHLSCGGQARETPQVSACPIVRTSRRDQGYGQGARLAAHRVPMDGGGMMSGSAGSFADNRAVNVELRAATVAH